MIPSWPEGPARPEAAAGEVHLWLASLEEAAWPGREGLPAYELKRASGFLRPEIAARWVASRWALRQVLGGYLSLPPGEIEIEIGKQGKPRLANDRREIEVNLSHSGEVALVAVARGREVGVDVERIEPGRDCPALAERALPPEVAAEVRSAPPDAQPSLFHRAWTRHEARLKCLGVGLSGAGVASAETVAVADLGLGPAYAAAVAVRGRELGTLRCWSRSASAA